MGRWGNRAAGVLVEGRILAAGGPPVLTWQIWVRDSTRLGKNHWKSGNPAAPQLNTAGEKSKELWSSESPHPGPGWSRASLEQELLWERGRSC